VGEEGEVPIVKILHLLLTTSVVDAAAAVTEKGLIRGSEG
jgi:hypothetical protein